MVLLLPTPEQYEQFARHMCGAHSWYKHLPLLQGAEFIFFLSEEAGAGYSEERPRIHHTWKTTQKYRDRFGYLDYMYRLIGEDIFRRDGRNHSPLIPSEYLSSHSIILYPFVSDDYNASEVIAWTIQTELEDLQAATSFPKQQEVLAWYDGECMANDNYPQLSESERRSVASAYHKWQDGEETAYAEELARLPPDAAKYLRLRVEADSLYRSLQESEFNKIHTALAQLRSLSEAGTSIWF
ncbi:MAG: hypothetical protein AAGA60_16575 [Cyanobacteria bacterium P01_E01_bin.42]